MTPEMSVVVGSLRQLVLQLTVWIPKIVIGLVIWFLGRYFLNFAVAALKKVDIPGTKKDNQLIKKFSGLLLSLGNFLLLLVVLDYLEIAQTLITAFVGGLTFAVAITLGIAFGQALTPEAKHAVEKLKKYLG